MLPDVPGLKKQIHSLMQKEYQQEVYSRVPISRLVRHHSIHEGRTLSYGDIEGTVRDGSPRLAEAVFTVSIDEVPFLGPAQVREKLRRAAAEMSRQMSEIFLATLNEVVEEAGNLVHGRPFDQDTFLELVGRMPLDFDSKGNVQLPTLLAGREMASTMKDRLMAWKTDAEFTRRWTELMARKRQEWHDRKGDRALVD